MPLEVGWYLSAMKAEATSQKELCSTSKKKIIENSWRPVINYI